MCFHSKQTKEAVKLAKRFKAILTEEATKFKPGLFNGFQFPKLPVITNQNPGEIDLYHWGLLPSWSKDIDFRKNTLNAKIETIAEKPSFKPSLSKRCLVLVNGFYEWQWLDEQGKKKQKYQIGIQDEEPFAFAGLYNEWVDKSTGEVINTFTILTTEAKGLMAEIHNSKLRMPVILKAGSENDYLLKGLTNDQEVNLIAEKV